MMSVRSEEDTTQVVPTPAIRRTSRAWVHRLVRVFGPGEPGARGLTARAVTVGRSDVEADWAVDDPSVSRRHFAVEPRPSFGVVAVRDLGSRNGTWIAGAPVKDEVVLDDGAVILAGHSLFVYERAPGHPAVDLTRAPATESLRRFAAGALVERVAPCGLPVLLFGPTGAGKEVLAQRIHAQSGREGALVAVNCGALSRELAGSELFGHVAGAFTGAEAGRPGLFQAADGGTLFLDEVAELPVDLQPILLRVLQEGTVRSVGSDHETPVDVRVVAATHQNLATRVEKGCFRRDLLARLAGVSIDVPGLSLGRVDTLPLFQALLGRPVELTVAAANALLTNPWVDNIRGLQHLTSQIRVFFGDIEALDIQHLHRTPSSLPAARGAAEGVVQDDRPTRAELLALLEAHDGNVSSVARALGWRRQRVYTWMQALGIRRGDERSSER